MSVNEHIELLALTGSKNADGVIAELVNDEGNVYFCAGNIAAPAAKAGYAVGCIYRRTDSPNLYVNQGTTASCNFTLIGTVGDGGVTLAKLAAGVAPSHVVKYAGIANYAGGAAAFNISVPGVLTTDVVQVTLAASANVVSLVKAASAADNVAVTLSGDPGAGTKINYTVYKAAS